MSKASSDVVDRDQLRLVFAVILMHAEISAARGLIDDNGELAARGLRRADMLFELHDRPKRLKK